MNIKEKKSQLNSQGRWSEDEQKNPLLRSASALTSNKENYGSSSHQRVFSQTQNASVNLQDDKDLQKCKSYFQMERKLTENQLVEAHSMLRQQSKTINTILKRAN